MNRLLGALLLLALLSGCTSPITPANLAGYYASEVTTRPAPAPTAHATEPVGIATECFQLFLHPDGHYVAVQQRFLHGQPVRNSAVGSATQQERSTGSWKLDGARLLLTSKAESQGTATAQILRKHSNWSIVWDTVEYAQQPPDMPDGWFESVSTSDLPTSGPRQATSSADRH